MIIKSYGLVGDADGHSQRVHRPYLSLTTSRFVVLLPTTVLLEFTYEFDIHEKACFSRSRGGGGGGNSIVPFKVGGALVDSVHVATAVSECGQSTV